MKNFDFQLLLKPLLKRALSLLVLFTLVSIFYQLNAQSVDTTGLGDNGAFEGDRPDTSELLNIYYLLLGALNMVWGIVAKAFGLKEKFNNFIFVVISGGIVIAGGFMAFGWVEFLPSIFTLLTSMGLFDLIKASVRPDSRMSNLINRLETIEKKQQLSA